MCSDAESALLPLYFSVSERLLVVAVAEPSHRPTAHASIAGVLHRGNPQ